MLFIVETCYRRTHFLLSTTNVANLFWNRDIKFAYVKKKVVPLYRNDTILKFTKKTLCLTYNWLLQANILSILLLGHWQKEKEFCTEILVSSRLTTIVWHPSNYSIETTMGGEDIPFWQSKVDNEKSFTFTFPEYPEEHKSTRFYIRFTTLHYGTYVSSVFSSY